MIEACEIQEREGRPARIVVRAESEYEVRIWDDEEGQTWIQFRELDDATEPRPVGEFIRDVWIGL